MRRGQNSAWLEDANNQMIGCNLGSDFTAEHEWGIKELYETLGVTNDKKVMGIERYRVGTPRMNHIALIEENKSKAGLICLKYEWDMKCLAEKKLEKFCHGELDFWPKEQELATAWDGSSFGIRVQRPTNIKRIKRLYKAIQEKDAAVWLGGGGVFKNAGLIVAIISAVPEEQKKQMLESHLDYAKLQDAADKTGIVQKIDKLNEEYREKNPHSYQKPFGYYSLRPNWPMKTVLRGDPHVVTEIKSNHPVIFWLNPQEQQKNQSGWYTVEELEQWIEGKGPVVENSKDKRKAKVS